MKKITDNRAGISWKLQNKLEDIGFADCVFTNRKEKPYAEEITETGGRGPKNRVENKRQENHYIGK
jgi:hypothetical protein